MAELLKPLGYRTGQFGKNHLGDRDEHLPTMHGFDEFFGNLYHLNAEQEPELPTIPTEKDFPSSRRSMGRAACCTAGRTAKGGQKIENTGPLTKKRMETIDARLPARRQGLHPRRTTMLEPVLRMVQRHATCMPGRM